MQMSINGSTMTVRGNIKSIQDFQEIKEGEEGMIQSNPVIHFELLESMSLTSSVIGYINKLIRKDGIRVSMVVEDSRLYDLLSDLNLITAFNVSKKR